MIAVKACAIAGEMVRAIGFERRYTSLKSEATYYGWPGKEPVIRIGAHKASRATRGQAPVIATITFSDRNIRADKAGVRQIPRDKIIRTVAIGIGIYFLRTAEVIAAPAKFRDRWEGFRRELNGLDDVTDREIAPLAQTVEAQP
jgi:hypothetical protein